MSAPLRTYRPRATRLLLPVRPVGAYFPAAACIRGEELSAFMADRAAASRAPWDDVVPGCGATGPRELAAPLD